MKLRKRTLSNLEKRALSAKVYVARDGRGRVVACR